MNYIFISDEFYEFGSFGGAETCNHELISRLRARGHRVESVLSFFVDVDFILENKNSIFIIGNFLGLIEEAKQALQICTYFIYEHDHKYLRSRDPSVYPDYLAPDSEIINRNFYKNSYKVIVQSSTHKEILVKNLNIENVEVGINLWSQEHLMNLVDAESSREIKYDAVVMDHIYHQKNTLGALNYCKIHNWSVLKIPHGTPHREFCFLLSQGERFVFFPNVLETLSRVSIEAQSVGCRVIGNQNVSFLKESWSNLFGQTLTNFLYDKGEETVKLFESI